MMSDNAPVLTGWKAIAGFLKRDERTAMRWAAQRGLPVRRVPGGKRGPVYAVPAEIAQWLAREAQGEEDREHVPDRSDREPPNAQVGDDRSDCDVKKAPPPPTAHLGHRRGVMMLAAALAGAAGMAATVELGLVPIRSAASPSSATLCRSLATAFH